MLKCERCGKEIKGSFTWSLFEDERICKDCEKEEKEHPDYERVRQIEAEQVKAGNLNYNHGLPDDLKKKYGRK